MACRGQAREVDVVAEGESPAAPEHGEVYRRRVGVSPYDACAEGQVAARVFVDIPAHVAAVDHLVEVALSLVAHHRQQAPVAEEPPFGAAVDVEVAAQAGVGGDVGVADVGLVDVAQRGAELGVEHVAELRVECHAGAEGGVDDLGAVEALGAVGHHDAVGAEAHLAQAAFEPHGDDVAAVADALEVADDGRCRRGAVAEGAGAVVADPQACVEAVAVHGAAREGHLGGGAEGLEGGAHRGPLVAVDGPEARRGVEEAAVGGVEEQRVEVEHREVYVLRLRAIEGGEVKIENYACACCKHDFRCYEPR